MDTASDLKLGHPVAGRLTDSIGFLEEKTMTNFWFRCPAIILPVTHRRGGAGRGGAYELYPPILSVLCLQRTRRTL